MSLFDEPAPLIPTPSAAAAALPHGGGAGTEPSGSEAPVVRVRLQLAYDGRRFHGFSPQPGDVRTVAGELSGALARVLRLAEPPVLTCAGRTDAGVHAWNQWVHVDLPAGALAAPAESAPDLEGLQRRLVKLLAPEVVVRSVALAGDGWDARHSARTRTYRYSVLTTPVPDPFRSGFVWWRPGELDLRAMNLACDALIGEHDFASFCRRQMRRDGETATLVRRVLAASWCEPEPGVARFEITASAFCQQMVRAVAGTLVEVGCGKRRAGEMLALLRAADRALAAPVAPPDGLVLWEVAYP